MCTFRTEASLIDLEAKITFHSELSEQSEGAISKSINGIIEFVICDALKHAVKVRLAENSEESKRLKEVGHRAKKSAIEGKFVAVVVSDDSRVEF